MKKILALVSLLAFCNLLLAYTEARAGGAHKKIADIKSLFEKKIVSHEAAPEATHTDSIESIAQELRSPANKNPYRTPPVGSCLMDSGRNGDVIICNGASVTSKGEAHAEAPAHPSHSSDH